jgi:hypothetical protein
MRPGTWVTFLLSHFGHFAFAFFVLSHTFDALEGLAALITAIMVVGTQHE